MFVFVINCDRKWMKQLQKKNWAMSKRGTNPKTILFGLALVQIQKLMRSVIGSQNKLTLKGGGTEDDEMEDDPSDETAERDIRCGLFYTKC